MGAQRAARIGSTPQLGLEARHSSRWEHKADGRPRSSSHWEHATSSCWEHAAARVGSTRRSSHWEHAAARVGSTRRSSHWEHAAARVGSTRRSSHWEHAAARVGSTRRSSHWEHAAARVGSIATARMPQLGKHKADGRPRSSSHWEHGRWAPKERLALGARHKCAQRNESECQRKRAHQVSARQKYNAAEDKNEDRSGLNVFSSGWKHGPWAPMERLALGARHKCARTNESECQRKRAHQGSARQKNKAGEDKKEDRSRLNVLSSGWKHGTWAPKKRLALGGRHLCAQRNESTGKRKRAHPSERPAKRQGNSGQERGLVTA
jgi:hypothetical protein